MPHSQPTALQQTVCKFHLDPQYHIFHRGSTILGDSTLCFCMHLLDDINKLSAWSSKWLLNFKANRCGSQNKSISQLYTLYGFPLKPVSNHKYPSTTISNDLKPKNHKMFIISKAKQRVGLSKQCFTHLEFDLIDHLFKTIVRSIS